MSLFDILGLKALGQAQSEQHRATIESGSEVVAIAAMVWRHQSLSAF
jgi:hypothetical protein